MHPSDQPTGPSQPLGHPLEGQPEGVDGPGSAPGAPAVPPGFPGTPPAPFAWQQWWRLPQGSRRPWRRTATVAVSTAASIAVLGVLLGLLWAWVAPTVPVVNAGESGVIVNDPAPEQYIAADGWFTLLGLGFGLLVTVGAWLTLRRDRGPFLLAAVVGGTFVAGHWVAPAIGEFIGRSAYDQWRATAAQGATYLAPPEVHSLGPTLVPAFAAAIVLTLLAGWSNDPDLDQPGAQPGYGPNHAYLAPYEAPYGEPAAPHGRYYPPPGGEPAAPPAPGSARPPEDPDVRGSDVLGPPDGTGFHPRPAPEPGGRGRDSGGRPRHDPHHPA